MDSDLPAKRRKVERQNDVPEAINTKFVPANLDVGSLSVKPDKIQKLRKIAASCEKIQNFKNDDVIISSVGSSPSVSPCPDNLTSLSTPVNAAELKARLTALVREEEVGSQGSGAGDGSAAQDKDGVPQIGTVAGEEKDSKSTEGKVHSPSLEDVGELANVSDEKKTKIPIKSEEFKALVKNLINERMKKLEESYTENVIPSLEKKIANLESDNKYLEDRTRLLQRNFQTLLAEYRKQIQQKPVQKSIAIQVGLEPPPLTPVTSGDRVILGPGKTMSTTQVDSVPGPHKQTSTIAHIPQPVSFVQQTATASSVVRYTVSMPTVSHGHMYTTISTMAGQPRLSSGANCKPGCHPNAVVSPRTGTTFSRPNGPVTATVYPQPHNVPMSPTNLGVPRNSPPSPRNPEQLPPNGYIYPQQPSNGVTIRTAGQPTSNPPTQPMPYPGNVDRRGHSFPVHSTLASRHRFPAPQGPPPDYQSTVARQQPQGSYQPTSVSPMQVNTVRHYSSRPAGPPPPRTAMVSAPPVQSAARQMMTANQMVPRAQATYTRPSGPPPLVRAQPQPPPQQHLPQTTSPQFQGPGQSHSMPSRTNGPPNSGNPNQVMPQTQGSHIQGRVQSSGGVPQVRLQGHPVPGVPSNGPHVLPQSSPTAGVPRDLPPPAPDVSISSVSNGIVLSWNMNIPEGCAQIDSYQLFAYQNNGNVPHSPSLWKKLGIVKALPLPMACTLTQFVSGSVYHFAVRAIDSHGRAGSYSAPCAITLPSENGKTGKL